MDDDPSIFYAIELILLQLHFFFQMAKLMIQAGDIAATLCEGSLYRNHYVQSIKRLYVGTCHFVLVFSYN